MMPTAELEPLSHPPAPSGKGEERSLIQRIEAELRAQADLGLLVADKHELGQKWTAIIQQEPRRFIRDDLTIRADALRAFRRDQVFISDYGNANLSLWNPRNWIDGARRGMRRRLVECLETLKASGDVEWLSKYPCHPAGRPYAFHRERYRYTYRWHKHIRFLGLFDRILKARLEPNFTALDIGSSYGIFSALLKAEYPRSRSILVDFPEQLLLAYYFLGTWFPQARIAGVRELAACDQITRQTFQAYDFLLVPCSWYERLAVGTANVITNFASLGEMQRAWFDYYMNAPVFTSAQYFFTVNRFQSRPTYDTDLTILDYPVWKPSKRLHFGVCPVFSHTYRRTRLVGYEKVVYTSQYFEYIGQI